MSQIVSMKLLARSPLDWVSDELGIVPSSCRRLTGGDGGNYIWKADSGTSPLVVETEIHFANLFKKLDLKWHILKRISETVDTPTFSVYIWIEKEDRNPIIELSTETIKRIADINGELSIDASYS